jgi:hypothetical protein
LRIVSGRTPLAPDLKLFAPPRPLPATHPLSQTCSPALQASPIPDDATPEEIKAVLSAAGLPISRIDLDPPAAAAPTAAAPEAKPAAQPPPPPPRRAAWVRLVAPELPWRGLGLPYHLQNAVEEATLAPLAMLAGLEDGEGGAEGGTEGGTEGGAGAGAGAAGGEGGEAGGEGARRSKLVGPRAGDAAGEVYATPTSPGRGAVEGGGVDDVTDGDAWRIAREFAAQLKGGVEFRGARVMVEAPLVQVRGGVVCRPALLATFQRVVCHVGCLVGSFVCLLLRLFLFLGRNSFFDF